MSELPAPTSRPAPDALRRRIDRELKVAESKTIGPRHVIAPIAAVALLVAGVVGASQLGSQREVLPAQGPTPSMASGSASTATATATPTGPTTLTTRAMTAGQIAADTASCTKPDRPSGAEPLPHQGRWNVRYAVVTPIISFPASDTRLHRALVIYDELGTMGCLDGVSEVWSSGRPDRSAPTSTYAARSIDSSIGTGSGCSTTNHTDGQVTTGAAYQVADRVRTAHVTLRSAGAVVRVVEVAPVDGIVVLPVRVSGTAAWTAFGYSVQMLDRSGRPLLIDARRDRGTPASTTDTTIVGDCAAIERDQRAHAPKPVKRPPSDAAGDATCQTMIDEHLSVSGESFDVSTAAVTTRISTSDEWGVVLSDGQHYVGCSLFPTAEITSVRSSASAPTKPSFSWALNPIVPSGESWWAAGRLPGVEAVRYTLPDGTTVTAKISGDGSWLAMAQTTTAFDTEASVVDWDPVKVAVTLRGVTTTYSIGWSEKTMCNQVSHGC